MSQLYLKSQSLWSYLRRQLISKGLTCICTTNLPNIYSGSVFPANWRILFSLHYHHDIYLTVFSSSVCGVRRKVSYSSRITCPVMLTRNSTSLIKCRWVLRSINTAIYANKDTSSLSSSSSSSSYICHGVGPLVDPFRSHISRSLFKGLP